MNRKRAAAIAAVMQYLQVERVTEERNPPQAWLRHATDPWTYHARRTTSRQRDLLRPGSGCRLRMAMCRTAPEKGRRLQRSRNMAFRQALPIARTCMTRRARSITSGEQP